MIGDRRHSPLFPGGEKSFQVLRENVPCRQRMVERSVLGFERGCQTRLNVERSAAGIDAVAGRIGWFRKSRLRLPVEIHSGTRYP